MHQRLSIACTPVRGLRSAGARFHGTAVGPRRVMHAGRVCRLPWHAWQRVAPRLSSIALHQLALSRGPFGHQRGQSTTEFAVLALVLAPLFLLVPLLGKYLDMSQQAGSASRYAAFEVSVRGAAVSRDEATVAAEARRRLLGASNAPVKTGDVAGDNWRDRNSLWHDFRGDPLLPEFGRDVTHSAPAQSRNVLGVVAPFTGSNGFSLPSDNFFVATIGLAPARPRDFPLWGNVDLRMARRTAILVDPWAAANAGEVRGRIEGAGTPAYPIGPLRLQANTIGQLPALVLDRTLRVGNHDPDLVPCDRLNPPC